MNNDIGNNVGDDDNGGLPKSPAVGADLIVEFRDAETPPRATKVEPLSDDENEPESEIKKPTVEENGSSEDPENFCGYQPTASPANKDIQVLTKLVGEPQDALDSEKKMSAEGAEMDVEPEIYSATVARGSIAKKTTLDLSNLAFQKPFDYGWKREVVYRNAGKSSPRVKADVYYYTPDKKKIRSSREVSLYLCGTDLTTENFTFFKEPLGLEDTEKEMIRNAKKVFGKGFGMPKSPQVKKIPLPKTPKPAKKPKDSSKNSSPDSVPSEVKATAAVAGSPAAAQSFPRIKYSASQLLRMSAAASSSGGRDCKAKGKRICTPSEDQDIEMGMVPPNWPKGKISSPGSNQEME